MAPAHRTSVVRAIDLKEPMEGILCNDD